MRLVCACRYDFLIYTFLGGVITKLFFPHENVYAQVRLSVSLSGVAVVAGYKGILCARGLQPAPVSEHPPHDPLWLTLLCKCELFKHCQTT